MIEKIVSRLSPLPEFPTWSLFKEQGYDAYGDAVVEWLIGLISWSNSSVPMLDQMDTMIDGINDAVDTMNENAIIVATDKESAAISVSQAATSKGLAEAAQIAAEAARSVVESLVIATDPNTTYNKTAIDAKEAASVSEDTRINNLMFNIFDTLKNHGHEYARRLSFPAAKYLCLRAETSTDGTERRLIDWSKANRVVSMKSGKQIELTGTSRAPAPIEVTKEAHAFDSEYINIDGTGNTLTFDGVDTFTLHQENVTSAEWRPGIGYGGTFTADEVYDISHTVEVTSGQIFVNRIEYGNPDGSNVTHEIQQTLPVGTYVFSVEGNIRANGFQILSLDGTQNPACDVTVTSTMRKLTQVDNWLIVQRADGTVEQIAPEHDRDSSSVELLTNGDFSDGGLGWELTADDGSSSIENGRMLLHDSTGTSASGQPDEHNLVADLRYSLKWGQECLGLTVSNTRIIGLNGNSSTGTFPGLPSYFNGTGTFEPVFTNSVGATRFAIYPYNTNILYANVSLKQVLPVSSKYYFKNETVGPFFTNRNVVPDATMKRFNEDPELFAKVLEGSVTVEGVARDTMAAVFGIGEPRGAFLLDSNTGYISEALDGDTSPTAADFIPYSTATIEDANGYVKITVGGHQQGAYVYLESISSLSLGDQKTYVVLVDAYSTNPAISMRTYFFPSTISYQDPLSTTSKPFAIFGKADHVTTGPYLSFVNGEEGDEIYIKIKHIYEVSAIEIDNYIPSIRENVDQENGAQHALLKKDAAGMILGTPDDGWLGADGRVTALLDSGTELSNTIGGTVGYTLLDEVEKLDGTKELRITRYYPDIDTSTIKINDGAPTTTTNLHPFTKIEWTAKTALTGNPDQLAGRGEILLDELWDDDRVALEIKKRGY